MLGFGLWLLAMGAAFGGALARRAPPEIRPWQVGLKAVIVAWLIAGTSGPTRYAFTIALAWTWAGIVYGRSAAAPAWLRRPGGATLGRTEPALP